MLTPKRVGRQNKWGDSSRYYQIDENRSYPSVTTILSCIGKPALIKWSANVEREMVISVSADLYEDCPSSPRMSRIGWITSLTKRLGKEKASQKELAKAAEIGTQAHDLIEWTLRAELFQEVGHPPKISPKAQLAFAAHERWRRSVDMKTQFIEQAVWSDQYGYAGTADWIGTLAGRPALADWKSGKAIYVEALLQNAAYRHAFREMGHVTGECDGVIVRLPKVETDPEFEALTITQSEDELFKVFLSVFELWKWLRSEEAKKEQQAVKAVA